MALALATTPSASTQPTASDKTSPPRSASTRSATRSRPRRRCPPRLRPRQCRFDVALAYLPKWTFDDMSDWEHLLRDLACHLMARNATIHLELPIAQIMDNPNGLKALATRFGHLHRIRSYAASGRLSPAADIHASFSNLQPFRSDCRHLLR